MHESMSIPTTWTYAEVVEGVRRTALEYSHAVDSGSLESVMGLFTPDATVDMPRMRPAAGYDAVRQTYEQIISGHGHRHHLVVGTIVVAWDDENAEAVNDLVTVKREGADCAISAIGRYADKLVHVDGRWRFRSRVLTLFGG